MPSATAKILSMVPADDGLTYTVVLQVSYMSMLVNRSVQIPNEALQTEGTLEDWLKVWLLAYKDTLPAPDPHATAYNGTMISV